MNILELLNAGQGAGSNYESVNAKQFLAIEDGKSYSTPQEFLDYCKSLRPKELKDTEVVVKSMKAGLRVNRFSPETEDRASRWYSYLEFLRARGNQGGKLILEAGMRELLEDYLDDKVVVNFTLAELIEEAKQH